MADSPSTDITSVLIEGRVFPPPPEFSKRAHIKSMEQYRELADAGRAGPRGVLGRARARGDLLEDAVPEGARVEAAVRQVVRRRHHQPLLQLPRPPPRRRTATRRRCIFEGEPGDQRRLTYRELHAEVCKLANGLKSLGIKKGDRVGIYLPMIPEVAIAMLACARIGAVHSVVFGGFSAEALRERMNDAGAKVVITCDGGWRKGAAVPLKDNVDQALPEMRHGGEGHRRAADREDGALEGAQGRPLERAGGEAAGHLRAGVGGQRAPAVHPLHLGLDRKAEGRAPHHRRLLGVRLADHPLGVRPEGRRTSTGAPRTWAGSPGTATSSTAR